MSRRIREFDWTSTPLGPHSGWPEHLRVMVDLCLTSALPCALWIGPELTTVYNDAMIPVLYGKHPEGLGGPAPAVWSELWPSVGPVVEEVRRGSRGMLQTELKAILDRGDGPEVASFTVNLNPFHDRDGGWAGLTAIAIDTTEMRRSEQQLRNSERRLRMVLELGGVGTWGFNASEVRYTWSDSIFSLLGYAPGEVEPGYKAWASRVHPEDLVKLKALFNEHHRDSSADYRVVLPDGEIRWCEARWRSFYDEAGERVGMLGAMQDITERRQWEETQQLLIAELQHRTRNLLAVVRSLAAQTLRASGSLDEFGRDFNGRLSALSRVQGLLSKGEGQFVRLRDLLLGELAAHGVAPDGKRVLIKGREVRLSAKAVQILTLALHELATNAVKHGALSQPAARLLVSWEVARTGDQRIVTIRWAEEGVALPANAGSRRGFGRELIERAIPYDLGARTALRFTPGGIVCEIGLPLRRNPLD